MYKISTPIINSICYGKAREKYLSSFKKGKIERVFLVVIVNDDRKFDLSELPLLTENVRFFENNGIEVCVWIGNTIGHGGRLIKEDSFVDEYGYTNLVTMDGAKVDKAYCPLDKKFVAVMKQTIKDIAISGVKTIVLDDDYRMSQHRCSLCCSCELHLKEMSKLLGEEITIENLNSLVFLGGSNKYRDAYIEAQRFGLISFAKELRAAVDEISPEVRIALCSAWSLVNIDGVDGVELTKILAGNNPPLLRIHGAPYWAIEKASLGFCIESARMMSYLHGGRGVEIISEGDTYPRPRYVVPASYLELFDAAMRADGSTDGILKYMFDYHNVPEYETGYVDRHIIGLKKQEELSKVMDGGIEEGVRIRVASHTFKDSFFYEDYSLSNLNQSPYANGAHLSTLSIPTTYSGKGILDFIIGENARGISIDEIKDGCILDATAALIFAEKGLDVGIDKVISYGKEIVTSEKFDSGEIVACYLSLRVLRAEYSDKVKVLSTAHGTPLTILYENKEGKKFYIFCFSVEEMHENIKSENSTVKCSYARQKDLKNACEWISGKRLPVYLPNCPELYPIVKRKDKSMAVAIFNCYADEIINARISLDKVYKKVNCYGFNGKLDKDCLVVDGTISAYSYVFFELFE